MFNRKIINNQVVITEAFSRGLLITIEFRALALIPSGRAAIEVQLVGHTQLFDVLLADLSVVFQNQRIHGCSSLFYRPIDVLQTHRCSTDPSLFQRRSLFQTHRCSRDPSLFYRPGHRCSTDPSLFYRPFAVPHVYMSMAGGTFISIVGVREKFATSNWSVLHAAFHLRMTEPLQDLARLLLLVGSLFVVISVKVDMCMAPLL